MADTAPSADTGPELPMPGENRRVIIEVRDLVAQYPGDVPISVEIRGAGVAG